MQVGELYQDTIDLLIDTNEDSYPLDFFIRDLNSVIKLYHPRVLNWQTDYNEYVQAVEIELIPATLALPGMEGYKGRYSLPDDIYSFIRVEISRDGQGEFKRATKKDINDLENCDESENFDNCCNCNAGDYCGANDCNCYMVENNMIVLSSYPKRRGMMKIWYLRKPKKAQGKKDKIDFVDGFEDLLGLECALRYARRHTGQFAKDWWEETKTERTRRAVELDRFLENRFGKNSTQNNIPLTI